MPACVPVVAVLHVSTLSLYLLAPVVLQLQGNIKVLLLNIRQEFSQQVPVLMKAIPTHPCKYVVSLKTVPSQAQSFGKPQQKLQEHRSMPARLSSMLSL